MHSFLSVVWGVARRGRDRTMSVCRAIKPLRHASHGLCRPGLCPSDVKALAPEVPRGTCTQCLKFLLLHSLCFGHLPCEGLYLAYIWIVKDAFAFN